MHTTRGRTRRQDPDLAALYRKRLREAIDATTDPETGKPITDQRFAETVLGINERTLRSYLASPPARVREVMRPVRRVVDRILAERDGSAERERAAAAERRERALEALTDVQVTTYGQLPGTAPEIARRTGLHETTVRSALRALRLAGLADQDAAAGRNVWTAADA